MRIIFSRKGFDSASGGGPSAIIDHKPYCLPIPTSHRSQTTFDDLALGNIVQDLTGGRIGSDDLCHHDPNLAMGVFGQVGSAQSHLANQEVGVGDLFLFWGLYRAAELTTTGYQFVPRSRREHRLFGWLQVGNVINLGTDGGWFAAERPEFESHPHCSDGWNANNTLYLAGEELRLADLSLGIPGAGTFPFATDLLRLSAEGDRTSLWRVPPWLNPRHGGSGLSYHSNPNRWGNQTLQTVARGQEFVAPVGDSRDATAWLESIFAEVIN